MTPSFFNPKIHRLQLLVDGPLREERDPLLFRTTVPARGLILARFTRLVFLAFLAVMPVFAFGAPERIVSASPQATEIIYAFGKEKELVGVDSSSIYPEAATKLPQVGHPRRLSAESILALNPTILFVNRDAGPPEAIQQVEASGVKVVRLFSKFTANSATQRIADVGKTLGYSTSQVVPVIVAVCSDLDKVSRRVGRLQSQPKVMFIYAQGPGGVSVSGTNTSADAIITMTGGVNAVTEFENYQPLTAGIAGSADPQVILTTTQTLKNLGGVEGFLQQPGIAKTPAGKTGRIIAMDESYLLGFGPRLGKAALELCKLLHPEGGKGSKSEEE